MTALPLLLAAALAQPAVPEAAPALVYLADGSSLPLSPWTLSYDFVSWPQGASPEQGVAGSRETSELWLGKRRLPMTGVTVEFVRADGAPPRVVVASGGRRREFRAEAPARELLQVERGRVLVGRSLDLHGQTLTGTRRDFCLLSFSAMVACGGAPSQMVTRIEFP